ncbi:MAG: MGMT family protein, partial [Candidatus Aenigmatarchaeota archaeon]
IPKGKVTTYKILAEKLKTSPRTVAAILRKNKNYSYPCYKVVCSNGSLGGYNRGIKIKISLLEKDGTKVSNKKIVDFRKRLFRF